MLLHFLFFKNVVFQFFPECQNLFGNMASLASSDLTHCGLGMPYSDRDLGKHWLR